MLYIEISIIALITLLQTIFIIFLHRGMITVIQRGLLELDNKLASAIKGLLEGNIDLPESVNPMQQMIMQIIQQKMQQNNNIDPKIIMKDESGKYKGT